MPLFITQFSLELHNIDYYRSLLSSEEKALAARKYSQALQDKATLSFALRRHYLAQELNVQPQTLHFRELKHGKPVLVKEDLYFNVSHSEDYWAILINAEHPCGVDIEWTLREVEFLELAKRFFTQQEANLIEKAPDPKECFWQIWTAKEALLKATGEGIAKGLDLAEVSLDSNGQWQILSPAFANTWQIQQLKPYPNVLLTQALCDIVTF